MQSAPVDTAVPLPLMRLVTLGTANGSRVLLDLGQATGVIRIDGNAADLRALVRTWATELAASPWSDNIRVVLSGLGNDSPAPGAEERVRSVSNTRDALSEIATAEGPSEGPGAEMLRGSRQDPGKVASGVLILASAPSGREAEQVQALASRPDGSWAVIVLGGGKGARWRFTLGPDGQLDTGVLGIAVLATNGLPDV